MIDEIKKYSRRLIFSLALMTVIVLSAQVCYAYGLKVDVTLDPAVVNVNNSTAALIHVYDADHGEWKFAQAWGSLFITTPSGSKSIQYITDPTGNVTIHYTPTEAGTFRFMATASYDYSRFGISILPIGADNATSKSVNLTVKEKFVVIPRTNFTPLPLPSGLLATPTPTPTQTPAPTQQASQATPAVTPLPEASATPTPAAMATPAPSHAPLFACNFGLVLPLLLVGLVTIGGARKKKKDN